MPRSLALSVFLLLLPAVALAVVQGDDASPVVWTASGPVAGRGADGASVFRGIPYAAPPVGAFRWRPPQPVAPWTVPRDATAFGPSCPQPGHPGDGNFREDCLSLNVWTPSVARAPGAGLPVMVWIHGGAFQFGGAAQPEYDGENLSRQGVVVVTVNYRLGPLGFLVHPLLDRESGRRVSGNYGLLDQIAALDWVRENIAAFGGDPGRVTVFGQSAGSRSVSLLMLSPLAAGLFHRAIAQSGGPILGSEYLSPAFDGDKEDVAAMGRELSHRLGCDTAPDELAALRALPAEDILSAADTSTSLFRASLFFAPVFDGWVLPDNPAAAFLEGRQHGVPMLVGSTANEGTLYLVGEKGLTLERYKTFLRDRFAGDAAEALALFPATGDADVPGAVDHVVTVAANAEPARFMAGAMAAKGIKAFLYQFTRRPGTAMAERLGAHHGVDIAYVFGHTAAADGYTDTDRALSRSVMAFWVNFARTGDPNGLGLVSWPAYESVTDRNLEFGDTVGVNSHLFQKECDFIDRTSRFRSR